MLWLCISHCKISNLKQVVGRLIYQYTSACLFLKQVGFPNKIGTYILFKNDPNRLEKPLVEKECQSQLDTV